MKIEHLGVQYNNGIPITPEELLEIVQDRYPYYGINIAHRDETFTLEWGGVSGLSYSVFCRDRAELESMKLRVREAGFNGEFKEYKPPPPPLRGKGRKC